MSISLPWRCFKYTSLSLSNLGNFDKLAAPKLDILVDDIALLFAIYALGLVFSGLVGREGFTQDSDMDLFMKSFGLSQSLIGLLKSCREGITCIGCWAIKLVISLDFLPRNIHTTMDSKDDQPSSAKTSYPFPIIILMKQKNESKIP